MDGRPTLGLHRIIDIEGHARTPAGSDLIDAVAAEFAAKAGALGAYWFFSSHNYTRLASWDTIVRNRTARVYSIPEFSTSSTEGLFISRICEMLGATWQLSTVSTGQWVKSITHLRISRYFCLNGLFNHILNAHATFRAVALRHFARSVQTSQATISLA